MANNNRTIRLKIAVKTLLVLALLLVNASITLAGDPAPPATPPASGSEEPKKEGVAGKDTQALSKKGYESFNVKQFLTIDGEGGAGVTTGTQKQGYFASDNPTAAFIVQVINFITLTAASLSFLAVVVGGFLMMSSAGNENQRGRGIEILTKAVIGLVITLSAYFIVAFVQNLLFETAAK